MQETRATPTHPDGTGRAGTPRVVTHPFSRCGMLSALILHAVTAVGCTSGSPSGPAGGGATGGTNGPGDTTSFLCDRGAPVDPGPSPLQRLTPGQYSAAARALFGSDLNLEGALPAAASASHIGLAQADPSQVDVEQYSTAAKRVGEYVEKKPTTFAPCDASGDATMARSCARNFLKGFGTRIYRSPLEDRDVERLTSVFDVGFEGGGYAHGIALTVEAMMQAPRFLYRPEIGDMSLATATAVPLTAYEVASRLSFAFWNQGPDEPLLAAAAKGDLSTPEGVSEQARRLSKDQRAAQSFRDFLRVWFGLADWNTVEKDPAAFPEWSEETRAQLDSQSEAFFDTVLFSTPGTLESLFTLDPARFVPDEMAAWKVEGNGSARGLLALPALLSRHSKPTESFPIYRGLFVREQLLCDTLPAPPDNVGEPPEPARGVSSRERFEQHSKDASCRGCHVKIDPLGFAFENYDAVGRFRTTEEGHPIDASGELVGTDVDGKFADLGELSSLLATSETVRACSARQWFRFVMQRFEQPADNCSMHTLVEDFSDSGYRFSALRTAIVQTPAFRMRRPIATEGDNP